MRNHGFYVKSTEQELVAWMDPTLKSRRHARGLGRRKTPGGRTFEGTPQPAPRKHPARQKKGLNFVNESAKEISEKEKKSPRPPSQRGKKGRTNQLFSCEGRGRRENLESQKGKKTLNIIKKSATRKRCRPGSSSGEGIRGKGRRGASR